MNDVCISRFENIRLSKKKTKTHIIFYFVFVLFFWTITFFEPTQNFLNVLAIMNIIFAVLVLRFNYLKTRIVISPINLVCVTWGILISISSFSFPVMLSMSTNAWNKCLLTEIIALLTCFIFQKDKIRKKGEFYITRSEELFLIFGLIISILVVLYAYSQVGFSNPLSSNVDSLRTSEFFSGFNMLSNFGTICVPILICNKKKRFKKTVYLLSLLYLGLLLISAIRFSFILCLIMLLSYKIFVSKKQLRMLLVVCLVCLLAFFFANSIRRSDESINLYFIGTNIYSGSIFEFNVTEPFRYIGYSQRLMDQYFVSNVGGANHGLFTLYPILKTFFIEPEMVSLGNIYGYNANNIITFLYADFGAFWPAGIFVFFAIDCKIYNWKVNSNGLIASYFWSVTVFAITLSFFAYVNQYVYWLTIYPVILIFVHLLFGGVKKCRVII